MTAWRKGNDPLRPPTRLLLGPGPSNVAASVVAALGTAPVGHLDPFHLSVLAAIRPLLRQVLGTSNELTFAIPGTGTTGMQAILESLLEPGDGVLVGACGFFGGRLAEASRRLGAEVTLVEGEWGRPLSLDALRSSVQGKKMKAVCVVHAETSTGVLQDLSGISELAASLGALLVVDAVTSAGATPVEMDARGIDALFTCTQKGLGCPSGLAPLSLSARAVEVMNARRSPVPSFALDLGLHAGYQAESPAHHHTSPSGLQLALHEALRLIHEEGLAARFQRHADASARALAGLESLGLEMFVPGEQRIPHLLAVRVPEGVDDAKVRRHLLERHSIEIGGGLGQLRGKIWRIGLMAEGAKPRSVDKLIESLREGLKSS